jgi:hypothetical protein
MKVWIGFNKGGIGGLQFTAKDRKEALELAKDAYGRGAMVEYLGKKNVTVVKM